nr:reverse transcriptase domain-containing protein [Tanacetum cinerariifolium]
MRTRSSSNLIGESSPNPITSNPKRRNRRRSKQPFSLEESPLDTMADQRTMAELLRAPTKGYAEEIVVPPILAEHFELKHSLINMMTLDQFFGLEKDNSHDHIRWFNKITSTIKYKVRNSRNKSIFSQVKSSDSSSSSEIAKLTHAVNQQTSAVTTAMTAILKQFQATPPPASVKAIEEIYVTYGGAHPYYQLVSLSELEKIKKINEVNIKSMQAQINNVKNELRNEMQTLIQASMSNQTNELKNMIASFFQMNTASTLGLGPLPSNTITNLKGELKAITTRSGLVLDVPSVPMPPPFINLEEDERA